MANVFPNAAKKNLMNGSIDLDTDTFKVSLHTSSFSPNIDTLDYRDDLTNEVSSSGYTAGGATLASLVVTAENSNDRGKWDAADASWSGVTLTARYAVVCKIRGGAASADEVVGVYDFGSDITATAGTFTVQWHADGLLYIG